jgi:hypothetical protein
MAEHGGARAGAGRRKGSLNRRSADLIDRLRKMGVDPAIKLAELALKAEASGDDDLAVEANRALLPFSYPKLKIIEADVAATGDLAERLAAARARVAARNAMAARPPAPTIDASAAPIEVRPVYEAAAPIAEAPASASTPAPAPIPGRIALPSWVSGRAAEPGPTASAAPLIHDYDITSRD